MKHYAPVNIENLKKIQEKVFNLFPKDLLDKTLLFYIPNNQELFLNIPELKTELDNLGWTPHIHSFGFYIIQKTEGTTIHIDSGNRTYSFNIPILNCKNTFVNFYSSSSKPILVTNYPLNTVTYYRVEPSHCELTDTFEMITPHVINVKKEHNVTNNNLAPRITLLVRLKDTLSLDYLFE